jgi:hypothetical protein
MALNVEMGKGFEEESGQGEADVWRRGKVNWRD